MASKKGNAQIQIVKEEEEIKVPTLKELFDAYEIANQEAAAQPAVIAARDLDWRRLRAEALRHNYNA